MSEDEQEDYMSDVFLERDVRPGLTGKKRTITIVETKSKKVKSEDDEKRARAEGLAKPISTDNKGYSLLSKLGYKEGMSLGKRGGGRKDPIPLDVKEGRLGLGRDVYVKDKHDEMTFLQKDRLEKFQQCKRLSAASRRIKQDLKRSQLSCEELDTRDGHDEPIENWHWYSTSLQDQDDPPSSETEQLEELTDHLRSTYFYCIWCGTEFKDKDDLVQNCPGNNYDAHQS